MLENRIARYLAAEATGLGGTPNASYGGTVKTAVRTPARSASGPWQVISQADLYRLAFEQAREEAQRKHWSNNRIRRYYE
jgi:hypothetical protein